MKKIRNVVLILSLLLSFNGCEKNPVEMESLQNNGELTVDQAREFVDNQRQSEFTLKGGDLQKQTISIRADWNKAKKSNNGEFSVIETEIQGMGRFGFATMESMESWKSTRNNGYRFSLTKLVVIKVKKTGELQSFIMSIVGERQHLVQKNFNLSNNSYLKRDNDLTGYVLFHELTGEFSNGWIYCDGQITHSITEADNLDLAVQLKSVSMYALYQWVEYCSTYTTIGTVGGELVSYYSETRCSTSLEYVGTYSTSGYTATSGSSGGSGYYQAPTQPCYCTSICSVAGCGKCLESNNLKQAVLPGDGTIAPVSDPCVYCSGHPVPVAVVDASDLKNNPKADCIYQNLINGGILSGFISRYFGLTAPNQSYLGELNLTWTLGSSTETLPIGIPRNGTYYSVAIRLNENTLNTTSSTNVALSMLHEALHAKLIAEVYDEVGTTDFKSLLSYYQSWGKLDKDQEKMMLDSYFDALANGLNYFDQCQGINRTLEFYKKAIRYSLTFEIYGEGSSQDDYNAFIEMFYSSKNCN
ncbi:MAG: hypothetical protein K0M40_18140 [Prolixibacteraceae bacterium]|nr:hypothetical protein [Prolixibacteraceae bacterium]